MGWKVKRRRAPGEDLSDRILTSWRTWVAVMEEHTTDFAYGAQRRMSPAQRLACRDVLQRLRAISQTYLEILDGAAAQPPQDSPDVEE